MPDTCAEHATVRFGSGYPLHRASRSGLNLVILILLVSQVLSACEKVQSNVSDSTVVATINGDEITLGRLKNVLARTSPAETNRSKLMPEQIVEAMVNQTLAIEQAKKLELDQTPAVKAAIEEAKREILSRTFYDQLAIQISKPDEKDVENYYISHPALFLQRRIYTLKEVILPHDQSTLVLVRDMKRNVNTVDEFARRLRRHGIEVAMNSAIRTPESMPLEMLPDLVNAKRGDLITYKVEGTLYIAQIVGFVDAPISQAAADARIRNYLENLRIKEIVVAEEKRLRAAAKVEIRQDLSTLLKAQSRPALAASSMSEKSLPAFTHPLAQN